MKTLILDGDPQDGHRIEGFLWDSGFPDACEFYHAKKIEEAIVLTRTHRFHFVIIDPAFSRDFGLPLIKTVKDFSPSTKIIAFSLCSTTPCTQKCREQCLDQGADYHLDKMTQFDQLPAVFREHMHPALVEPDRIIKVAPKKTLFSILRKTFNRNTSLETPYFLRAKRSGNAF